MYELKKITPESIPEALKKAERYRLLGEPDDAESICLDILEIAPDNKEAHVSLLLALTDKFSAGNLGASYDKAKRIAEGMEIAHGKNYYLGLIFERRAKCYLRKGGPGSAEASHDWFIKAMESFERAMDDGCPQNRAATLRWNSCARLLNANPEIKSDTASSEMFLDTFETPH